MSKLATSEIFQSRLEVLEEWPLIQLISERLQLIECKCYLSGGAVRDLLIGVQPYDIDLTTDADEREILKLFPNAILVGRSYGVYKIPLITESQSNHVIIDLTIFREDGDYIDGRRPESILVATPQKDAERRDFTINAIFYDLQNQQIIDFVNGLFDLKNNRIKCVGEPLKRFGEDRLRLLRLVRIRFQMEAKYKLLRQVEVVQYDEQTLNVALQNVNWVRTVSVERFKDEISKVFHYSDSQLFFEDPLAQLCLREWGFDKLTINIEPFFELIHSSLVKLDWQWSYFYFISFQKNYDVTHLKSMKFSNEITYLIEMMFFTDQNLVRPLKEKGHQSDGSFQEIVLQYVLYIESDSKKFKRVKPFQKWPILIFLNSLVQLEQLHSSVVDTVFRFLQIEEIEFLTIEDIKEIVPNVKIKWAKSELRKAHLSDQISSQTSVSDIKFFLDSLFKSSSS